MLLGVSGQNLLLHLLEVLAPQRIPPQQDGTQDEGQAGNQPDQDLDTKDGAGRLVQEDLSPIRFTGDKGRALQDNSDQRQGNGLRRLGDQGVDAKERALAPHA